MERLTVSLPEALVRELKRISRASGLKVSSIVARALEQHLSAEQTIESSEEAPVQPTVLWKLKGRKLLTGPSPRLRRTRVGSWRIVDLNELPV